MRTALFLFCGAIIACGGRGVSKEDPPPRSDAGTADAGCAYLDSWNVFDPAEQCLRVSSITACHSGVGPPRLLCSVGPDGAAYLSGDDALVPGGQPCSASLELTVDAAPQCQDNADAGCAHLRTWEIFDPKEQCLRVSSITACSSGVGPPRLLCSVGPDGAAYLSGENALVPGGQPCSASLELTVDAAPQCQDNADAGC